MIFIAGCSPAVKLYDEFSCERFYVNLDTGTLNGLSPSASASEIKSMLPCHYENKDKTTVCGEMVDYSEKGFIFFITNDFIRITENYSGDFSEFIIGLNERAVNEKLGSPVKTEYFSDAGYKLYETGFGTVVLKFENGLVNQLDIYHKPPDQTEICF
ncbi:MAG: hypothetical protein Kow0098_24430 [Ignavibacteriaceae bacterium]